MLKLVNLAQVRADNFTYTADKGVLMNDFAIALIVKEIQARLGNSFYYHHDGKKIQLQEQILRQAYAYREAINKGVEYYEPLVFNR